MRQNLVRLVALVAVCALVAGAFAAGSTIARAAGSQDVVYIATGENFPDALGAGPVAALANGPVLLVSRNAIPAVTLGELNRLQPATIVIVGGTGVVSQGVANALAGLSFHPTVERLAGADRYATAVEISKSRFPADLDADTLDGHNSTDFVLDSQYTPAGANGFAVNQEMNIGYDDTVVRGPIKHLGTRDYARAYVVNYSLIAGEQTAGDGVSCSISDTNAVDTDHQQLWASPGNPANWATLAGTRYFLVPAGETIEFAVVCQHFGSSPDSVIADTSLTWIVTRRY